MADFGPDWGNPQLSPFAEVLPPTDISWFPSAPGWTWVLVLLLLFGLIKLWQRLQRYRFNAYRRDALAWIEQLPDPAAAHLSPEAAAKYQLLPTVLRKTASFTCERQEIALLSGKAWESWLDQRCPGCQFSSRYQGLLHQLAYAPLDSSNTGSAMQPRLTVEQLQGLTTQVRRWISQHRGRHD